MVTETLFFIHYDGVDATIFQGQVLTPLIKRLQDDPNLQIILISFEYQIQPFQELENLHPRLTIKIVRKLSFCGTLSLWPQIYQLKKIITLYQPTDIIARGLLAGYIAQCSSSQIITIQIRGLLSQEYAYLHNCSWKHPVHKMKLLLYQQLEKTVYQNYYNTHFIAVSPALKQYLQDQFAIPAMQITIEKHDLPTQITIEKKFKTRKAIRQQLTIPEDKIVYCYVGSTHKWQCPEETIVYLKQKYAHNNNAFLLLLSPEQKPFKKFLEKHALPESAYTLLTVPHQEVQNYLCAVDYGLLLREQHLLNWVSRPTKALEYWACHVPVLHNNTVDFVINLSSYLS